VKLKGKVIWLLMTARIHLLSADIRRPGRVGDLIIPILDPEKEDRKLFIEWATNSIRKFIAQSDYHLPRISDSPISWDVAYAQTIEALNKAIPDDYSAAAFSSLKSHFEANFSEVLAPSELVHACVEMVEDLIQPDIADTRRYQTLQALVNCTRKCLLPIDGTRAQIDKIRSAWFAEIKQFEDNGMK